TILEKPRFMKPVEQPSYQPIDELQLQQMPLLAVDDNQFVSSPEVGQIAVRVKIQQFKLAAFFQIIAPRGQVTPGDVRQENVLKIKCRLGRTIKAVEEVIELLTAILAPVVAKDSSPQTAVNVAGITQTEPETRYRREVLVQIVREEMKQRDATERGQD